MPPDKDPQLPEGERETPRTSIDVGTPPGERIRALEERTQHLAKKEELANVRTEIANVKTWFYGRTIAIVTVAILLLQFLLNWISQFFSNSG